MICVNGLKTVTKFNSKNVCRTLSKTSIANNTGGKDDLKSLFDRYKFDAKSNETSTDNSDKAEPVEENGEDKLKSLFAKFSYTKQIAHKNKKSTPKKESYKTPSNLSNILGTQTWSGKPKSEFKQPKFNPKKEIDYNVIPEELHTAVKWIQREATKNVLVHDPERKFFNFQNMNQLINETDWKVHGILIKKKSLSLAELKAIISDDLLFIPLTPGECASLVTLIPVDKVNLVHYQELEKKSIVMSLGGASFLEKIEEKKASLAEANNASVSNDKIFKPISINWECQMTDLSRKLDIALRMLKKNYKLELQLGPAAYLKAAMFNKTHLPRVHDVTRSSMKNNTAMSAKENEEFKEKVENFFTTRKYNANKSLATRNDIYKEVLTFLESLDAKYKTFGNTETFLVISVHDYNLEGREDWIEVEEPEETEVQPTALLSEHIETPPAVEKKSYKQEKREKKMKEKKLQQQLKHKRSMNKKGKHAPTINGFYDMKIEH